MAGLIAGIGLGLSAIGSGVSFGQAAQAARLQRKAEAEQKQLMLKAKQKAEKNFYETLNVPIDAFDNQFKANQAIAKQGITALQEGDSRNLVGGVGSLQAATSAANEKVRTDLQTALYDNNLVKVEAKEKLNQQLIDMEVGAAADQSQIARDYARDANAGIAGGIAGIKSAASSANALIPLFGTSKSDRAAKGLDNIFGGGSTADLTEAQAAALAKGAYNEIENPDYDPAVEGSEKMLQQLSGGTGMTQQARINKLGSYDFTPKEIRKLGRSKNKLEDFKSLLQEDRFKKLGLDLGSVTELGQIQKLLYGY